MDLDVLMSAYAARLDKEPSPPEPQAHDARIIPLDLGSHEPAGGSVRAAGLGPRHRAEVSETFENFVPAVGGRHRANVPWVEVS
jgi:hypothetical protein